MCDLVDPARRASAFYTGAITDILDKRGFMWQTLPAALMPLRPGMRFAGPAFTIEGRPRPGIAYDDSIRKVLTMLGSIPRGYAAVYQTHDAAAAHLGELSVTSLKVRGCVGAVIDGGCRDVAHILKEDFPVFARYITPQDCVPRWELTATQVPITIGGVRIEPDDYVVADQDGVVVIPKAVRDAVFEETEALVGTENEIRKAVREGMLPLEAYVKYGSF